METLQYIVKRDGRKVSFEAQRIFDAINKAFQSEDITNLQAVESLTGQVVTRLHTEIKGNSTNVETTQDIVEDILINNGYNKIAKKYILYRERHKRVRQEKVREKIEKGELKITLGGNKVDIFDPVVLQERLTKISSGLARVKVDDLTKVVVNSVYDNISSQDMFLLILNAAKEKIEIHYDYSYMSSRIVLDKLYSKIMNTNFYSTNLDQAYRKNFSDYVQKGVEYEMLSDTLQTYDLEKMAQALVPERDKLFMYLGLQILEDRYLLRDRTAAHLPYELPQWMWMRIAMGLAQKEEEKERSAIEFYNVLSRMDLVSSTPTLFNSGTKHSQMSSCYINTVSDSLSGIFKLYSDNASLSKWAGGLGSDWTPVRSTGSRIKGTNGQSQGVIPFIKIFNDVALAVNQGGKRKGAMCAYMEIWHADIEQFFELRKNTGDERRRAHDINTACWIPDLFMKRVQENGSWSLFSPSEVPDLHDLYGREFERRYEHYEQQDLPTKKTMKALDVWKKLLTMLYETGHPWLTFKDAINVRSPQDHCGRVHSSNLCTEITLNTSKDETAVCNLASLNLANMVVNGEINEELLSKTVETGMRMLDNVIDNNFYPIPEAKNANLRHRPVGLGLMGYQDALYQCGVKFDSAENLEFADKSMEMISYYAIQASSKLAKEREIYPTYRGSKWDRGIFPADTVDLLELERDRKINVPRTKRMDWDKLKEHVKEYGMRNSNTMAIAPTATIGNIAGVMPCTEPAYKNIYMKENLSGNFLVINKHLIDDLDKLNLWKEDILKKIKLDNGSIQHIKEIPIEIRDMYKETFEIDPIWILKAAALRAKWIDQSASTNIFINTTSGKDLSNIYQEAWNMGLKTTYYLRNKGASQITKTINTATSIADPKPVEEQVPVIESTDEVPVCLIDDPSCESCQ